MNATPNLLQRVGAFVRGEPVLTILVVALVVLQIFAPQPWSKLPALVDWQTVMTLAGLLILTKALEYSGFLTWTAHRLVHRIRSERSLAFLLIALAAVLSTIVTNDVALFVVVPLVLSLHKLTPLPLKRLIIMIALAVNAGSVLTPLGNPQNLFLWQLSGASFGRFVAALAPLCALLMAMLFVLAAFLFKPQQLDLTKDADEHSVDRALAGVAAVLFIGFVLLADAHRAGIALAGVAGGFLLWRARIVLKIDWLLLLIFVLMFVVLRSAAALPWIHHALADLALQTPMRAYAAGAVLSQAISNVPAAIVLAGFTQDWRALAFGVSVGGFGVAIGSLANLIAVRLSGERGVWLPFHLLSIPFWLIAVLGGATLLYFF
ncbi:Na+/H+ antiporter NhaD/arsenite permease-like protein [Paraburkholderia bannensis]|uniref:Na+/H+ antiporter NhaD/arsenite permease-like protein n=1 Tax=Paraburkholderia bannensis TaxID=765414 RepID=A0A7W9TSY9_9BURK|nr:MULTISPECIES: SLC13 family permease [Paraburkholderia]MBB3255923.1 Na+/H+ antiporter NhaD/arsenite permease-like protein [Paraburkholderia sp. WP4_3_2]MBB6100923.1 Na+/H+ antiporter NhaD/arsenite permease-like protein [Paraburkholderia bannensis]